MLGILEKVKTGTIILLIGYCAYLIYIRPGTIKQETKIVDNSVSNSNTQETTKVETVTDIKPSGEKIIKKTKVITKNTDKKTVSEKHTDDIHETPQASVPGLSASPRYSLGLSLPVYPTPDTKKPILELGYRALGNAWLTTSIGLYSKPDITVGIRLEF